MSNPKVNVSQKSAPSTEPKSVKKDSMSTFSEEEIRIRAYQIVSVRSEPRVCLEVSI